MVQCILVICILIMEYCKLIEPEGYVQTLLYTQKENPYKNLLVLPKTPNSYNMNIIIVKGWIWSVKLAK